MSSKSFTKVQPGSYVTDIEDLHIEIDRIEESSGYLDWHLFITRRWTQDGVDYVEHIYTNYAHTLREAKSLAIAYADADIILKGAI